MGPGVAEGRGPPVAARAVGAGGAGGEGDGAVGPSEGVA